MFLLDIKNNIKIGSLAGNKNLVLGIKNIAEEAMMDKGYMLVGSNDSTYKINFEVVYFDVMQTSAGVSVFHKNDKCAKKFPLKKVENASKITGA